MAQSGGWTNAKPNLIRRMNQRISNKTFLLYPMRAKSSPRHGHGKILNSPILCKG